MPKPLSIENQVRRTAKKIEFSIDSLEARLAEDGSDFICRSTIRGRKEFVRLIVRTRRGDRPMSWAMAILLNNQRIDGIDWEPSVQDHRGKSHDCKGWHRHIWTPANADTEKECLPNFNPTTIREFLLQGLEILKVQLRKEDRNADNRLSFD